MMKYATWRLAEIQLSSLRKFAHQNALREPSRSSRRG
jgi:hypothetical protein